MPLSYASHVDQPVTHSSEAAQLAFGSVGLVSAVWTLFGPGKFITGARVVATLVKFALTAGAREAKGAQIGGYVDKFLGASVAGHIVHGNPTVLLGKHIKPAARADEADTIADCAGEHVGFEGSDTVSIGLKPMSRVGDRLKCDGVICGGLETVLVGGNPSHEGETIEEAKSKALRVLNAVGGGLDAAGTAAHGRNAVRVVVKVVGTVAGYEENEPVEKAADKLDKALEKIKR